MEADARKRLIKLERELRPKNLRQKVRSIILSRVYADVDLEEDEVEEDPDPAQEHQRREALAEKLGEEVAADDVVFRELLPELITGSSEWLVVFGRGLAAAVVAPRTTWAALVAEFGNTPETTRNGSVMGGFLARLAVREPRLADELVDEAVEHPILGRCFPWLQCMLPIGQRGVDRLRWSLALGMAPIGLFRCLAWGRAHEPVPTADLRDLIDRISTFSGGNDVAIDIVFFRLFGDRQAKRPHEPEIVEAGRNLLADIDFEHGLPDDHHLALLITTCLGGLAAGAEAANFCGRLKRAADESRIRIGNYHHAFEALCKTRPRSVLDIFLEGTDQERRAIQRRVEELSNHRRNPLDAIPDDEVIVWCDQNPETRYETMASVVSYLQEPSAEAAISQWSGIALKLLERAPDPIAVARIFAKRFWPSGWTGSLAVILERRRNLLSELERGSNPALVEFAIAEGHRLDSDIEAQRKWEAEHDRERNARFE